MMKHLWKIVSGFGVVITMVAALFAADARYAKSEEVEQSISLMGMGVQQQIDTRQLDDMTRQKAVAKKALRNNPGDDDLIEEIEFLTDQIKFLRERIQETNRKISSGELK